MDMDDGLILNFNTSNNNNNSGNRRVPKVAKVKGNWKQRLQAKRAAKPKSTKKTAPRKKLTASDNIRNLDIFQPVSQPVTSLEPIKKRRIIEKVAGDQPVQKQNENSKMEIGTKSSNSVVISSLFTKNPTIPQEYLYTTKSALRKPHEMKSSNGVCTSKDQDYTSFETAGLDKILSQHLNTKLKLITPTNIQSKILHHFFTEKKNDWRFNDLLVQAQTGSGKSLAFILPIINALIRASLLPCNHRVSRTTGIMAMILLPTRELAIQIHELIEQVLQYSCRTTPNDANDHESNSKNNSGYYHWIVSGLIIGGDNKNKEKARIRKGINIVVGTPGRILDHLNNTSSFIPQFHDLKWIVLDEADRFMELGLQSTLESIFNILKNVNKDRAKEKGYEWFFTSNYLPPCPNSQLILCSATLNHNVQKLADYMLRNPIYISMNYAGNQLASNQNQEEENQIVMNYDKEAKEEENKQQLGLASPNQLIQNYIVLPHKLKLISLLGLILQLVEIGENNAQNKPPSKIIVFMITCDTVDYYHDLLTQYFHTSNSNNNNNKEMEEEQEAMNRKIQPIMEKYRRIFKPENIHKLHGNMEQEKRKQQYQAFEKTPSQPPKGDERNPSTNRWGPKILFCTDVAARGLDISNVENIIQFDAPMGIKDYVHRVGRTARLGKPGCSWLFLSTNEVDLSELLAVFHGGRYGSGKSKGNGKGKGMELDRDVQAVASYLQIGLERLVLRNSELTKRGQRAYKSSISAYATHEKAEKSIFHIKKLHLGHYAKSFALCGSPSNIPTNHHYGANKPNENPKKKKVQFHNSTLDSRGTSLGKTGSTRFLDVDEFSAY